MSFPALSMPVLCYATAAWLAITVLALSPPREGAMLMIPASGVAADAVNAAVAAHAALVAAGPLPGSVVVYGDRSSIARAIGGRAIVLTAAPAALCGSQADRTRR